MFRNKWILALIAANFFFSLSAGYAADMTGAKPDQTLHIDIKVTLEKANVVFDVDHLALMGDMPFSIAHIGLLSKDFKDWNVKGQIIAIFHSDAGYVTLDDSTYNTFRNVKTGNPYKELLVNLMNQGVQIELCGATAEVYKWVNANLIPGVKVNTNAMVRLVQLEQEGYVKL